MSLAARLHLRPVAAGRDDTLLLALYAATRAAELDATGWPQALREQFLAQQHALRETHYRREFPRGADHCIEWDGEAVGRLFLDRGADAHRLVDLALLPSAQGLGIGSHLLRSLQAEARAAGKPLRLHVTQDNPGALRLYTRLGFRFDGDGDADALYRAMHWRPEALAVA